MNEHSSLPNYALTLASNLYNILYISHDNDNYSDSYTIIVIIKGTWAIYCTLSKFSFNIESVGSHSHAYVFLYGCIHLVINYLFNFNYF